VLGVRAERHAASSPEIVSRAHQPDHAGAGEILGVDVDGLSARELDRHSFDERKVFHNYPGVAHVPIA
jgi:hypothetical protein